jgi:hypothetical protein
MKIMRSILSVAVMAAGVAAYPQNPQSWTVNVPFDFTVRHTNLEAGRYTVQQSGQMIILTSRNGKAANVMINPNYISKAADRSSLTFNVKDGEYALAQIKNQGSNTELDAVVSKRAQKPREEASTGSQTVEVAAVGTR